MIRWKNGDIVYPSNMWKSPTKRRIPRLLIEERAKEVGVLVYIEESWIVFHETHQVIQEIDPTDSLTLEFYAKRFQLLPKRIRRQDAYEWLQKPDNAILLWAQDNIYFAKPVRRSAFL